jgi:hypothetical protein
MVPLYWSASSIVAVTKRSNAISDKMIQVKAPGKLYIAGEYAVTEPGYKSVLIALDRFVTATIEEADQYKFQ